MRDRSLLICLVVVCAVSLFFVPWWASLGLFVVGYCLLGFLTYLAAIKVVQKLTGLNFSRANKLYKAAMTGDWSEISNDELGRFEEKPNWKSKLEVQLATLIIAERVTRETSKEFSEIMDPLEAQLSAEMKELSTKSELGYEKASAAYFANESDPDYERHMKRWYAQMKEILDDKGNPEQAANLRTTLEHEYSNVTMPDWDKAQIAKLLGKKF